MTTVERFDSSEDSSERQQFQLITANDFDLCEDLLNLTPL